MKKFSKFLLGLGAIFAITACSNDEILSPSTNGDITVSVSTQSAIASRALATIDGYELKCVMQLVSEEGSTIGTQDVQPVANGSASFTIKAADIDAGAAKALFWAEYVPTADAQKVYNSEDLLNISYATTSFDSSNANLVAAADAFAGSITTLTNGASITLTRPFIQFNFLPSNPEVAAKSTSLKVSYNAPSGYNVLTRNCTTDAAEALTFTNDAFASTASPWFTSYIFAPANMSKLDKAITMALEGEFAKELVIEEDKIPLDANYIVNVSAEIDSTPGQQDLNVNVTVDGTFENEPKPAQFEVGAYLTAAGVPTFNVNEAVAVVYYVGAMETTYGDDESSMYPTEYNGKTIKGYAVALQNTIKGRQQLNSTTIPSGLPANQSIINGTQNTKTLVENDVMATSNMVIKFNEFVEANPLAAVGTTTTDWYIPAQPQMQAWISMLYYTTPFPSGEAFGPTGTDAFKELFPINTIFDRDPIASCMYATCSINDGGNVVGCSMTPATDSTPDNAKFAQIDIKTKTQSVLCRPMFTIFE